MTKRTILLIRRDPSTLTAEECRLLGAAFPFNHMTFVRTDPANYLEHLTDCERIKPDAVLLPLDRPIPSEAMKQGFAHIAVVEGKLQKLEHYEPKFSDFVPKSE